MEDLTERIAKRGTDERVMERLKDAAEREQGLRGVLDHANLLLGHICNAYFNGDAAVPLQNYAVGRVLSNQPLSLWWEANKGWYSKRVAELKAQEETRSRDAVDAEGCRKRVARAALKKLSLEERRALGLTTGKRV